jgi:hypothetical protein
MNILMDKQIFPVRGNISIESNPLNDLYSPIGDSQKTHLFIDRYSRGKQSCKSFHPENPDSDREMAG